MAQTLRGAVAALQALVGALDGIREAPTDPKPSQNLFPFAITYAATGSINSEAQKFKDLTTLFLEVHVNTNLFQKDIETASGFHDEIRVLLNDNPTISDTVQTINFPIPYTFGRLSWGGERDNHIGFRYEVQIKQQG